MEKLMAEDDNVMFRVNGRDYAMPTSFTIGEMCDAERFFGVEFGAEAAGSSIRMAAALLWIAVHREDPTITVENIRSLPPEVFTTVGGDDARPPEPTLENDGNNGTSGENSGSDSAAEAVLQQISGDQTSATGVTSDPATSPSSHPGS
jgi:hypothetical protein